jgi:acetyl-CoA carboxylase beta subunit
MLFTKDYEANLSVCPRCDHHGRIGADARLRICWTRLHPAAHARASRTTRSSSAIPKSIPTA